MLAHLTHRTFVLPDHLSTELGHLEGISSVSDFFCFGGVGRWVPVIGMQQYLDDRQEIYVFRISRKLMLFDSSRAYLKHVSLVALKYAFGTSIYWHHLHVCRRNPCSPAHEKPPALKRCTCIRPVSWLPPLGDR